MERRAEGIRGAILAGYQVAGELGPWVLTLADTVPRKYWLKAAVDRTSAYWLRQDPLSVALVIGADLWTWHGVELDVAEKTAGAMLAGPPVVERGGATRTYTVAS